MTDDNNIVNATSSLSKFSTLSFSVGPYKVIMVLFAMSKIVSSKHVIDREPWYTGI